MKRSWTPRRSAAASTADCADWIKYERQVLLDAVNEERARLALPPAAEDQIKVAEQISLGTDYSRKLVLYCAEISIGVFQDVKSPNG